jgi:hypothetical protein
MMVICTGTGPISVAIGADGQPAGQLHVCPDCALGALGAVLPELARAPLHIPRIFREHAQMSGIHARSHDVPHACARAPPGAAA